MTVKGVCIDALGRVLVGRNHRDEWELPGGRPRLTESFPDCVVREIAEETGLVVTVSRLFHAGPLEVVPGRWVNVIAYRCHLAVGASPIVSDEHLEVAFLDGSALLRDGGLAPVYRSAVESAIEDGQASG